MRDDDRVVGSEEPDEIDDMDAGQGGEPVAHRLGGLLDARGGRGRGDGLPEERAHRTLEDEVGLDLADVAHVALDPDVRRERTTRVEDGRDRDRVGVLAAVTAAALVLARPGIAATERGPDPLDRVGVPRSGPEHLRILPDDLAARVATRVRTPD